jgi:hypothetical protein
LKKRTQFPCGQSELKRFEKTKPILHEILFRCSEMKKRQTLSRVGALKFWEIHYSLLEE